jgi:hypothetical protein
MPVVASTTRVKYSPQPASGAYTPVRRNTR